MFQERKLFIQSKLINVEKTSKVHQQISQDQNKKGPGVNKPLNSYFGYRVTPTNSNGNKGSSSHRPYTQDSKSNKFSD